MSRWLLLTLLILISSVATAQTPKPDTLNFKDHVSAILRKHCLNCHNPDKSAADFDVSSYQAVMAGGSSGEAVKAGNAGQSLLYKLMAHEAEPRMPPKGNKVPDAELAIIRKWIDAGAAETAVGAAKNASRKIDIDPVAVTQLKPSGPPPMPVNIASVNLAKPARPHPITALAASPWAPLLAVSGHERIELIHTDTLKSLGTLPFPERIPHVLQFSRNGKWLLAAGGRGAVAGKVVIWDVTTGRRVTEIGDEADSVLAADISPNHQLVALGGPGKLIKIYDTATGQLKHKIKKHTDWITAIRFSPNGELLATGDRNGNAYLWEPETGGIVFTLGDHKDAITSFAWRADSQLLASASEDGKVIQWLAEDGFPARTITMSNDPKGVGVYRNRPACVVGLDMARNGLMITTSRDLTAKLWAANGTLLNKLEGFTDLPTKAAFSHDGTRVFVGDFTGRVRAWTVNGAKPVGEIQP